MRPIFPTDEVSKSAAAATAVTSEAVLCANPASTPAHRASPQAIAGTKPRFFDVRCTRLLFGPDACRTCIGEPVRPVPSMPILGDEPMCFPGKQTTPGRHRPWLPTFVAEAARSGYRDG
jgi:hypothetical protein